MRATITRWRSASSVVGKNYVMGDDGPASTTRGSLFDGKVEVFRADTAADLVELVYEQATSRDLFTLGVPQHMTSATGSMGITTITRREHGCVIRDGKSMAFSSGRGWALLDIDTKDAPAEVAAKLVTSEQVLAAVRVIIPDLLSYEFALLPSSSNGLLLPGGTPAKRPGWHLFILLEEQNLLPQTLTNLLAIAFLSGWGWPMVTKAGTIRPRGLVDLALIPTNQPIFPGNVAACLPPLSFAKPVPLINSGRPMPHPTINEAARDEAKRRFADMANAPEIEKLKHTYSARAKAARRAKLLAKGLAEEEADAKLAQPTIAMLQDDDVLTLNDGSEITVAAALDVGDLYNGVYMRDPLEPEYGTSRAILRTRPRPDHPYEKPVLLSFAHGGSSGFGEIAFRPSAVYRFARYEVQSKGVPLGVLLGFAIDNEPAPTLPEAQDQMACRFRSFVANVEKTPPTIQVGKEIMPGLRERVAIYTATGLGKTEQVAANAAKLVRVTREASDGGKTVVIAVPRHNLADAVAERIREKLPGDIRLEVYRGRSAKISDDRRMCGRWQEAEAVADAGANVTQALCGSVKPGKKQCQFFHSCQYIEQTQTEADIWIVPHALLGAAMPACLDNVGVLFIDEDPLMSLLPDEEVLTLDAIERPLAISPEVDACLKRVADALRTVPVPHPTMRGFNRAWVPNAKRLGLDVQDLRARYYELAEAMEQPENLIDAEPETVAAAVARLTAHNRHLLALRHLLNGLFFRRLDVEREPEFCPYIERRVGCTEAGFVEQVAVFSFNNLAGNWRSAHTMLLSATARPELMRHVWPSLTPDDELLVRRVEMPNVRVRQTLDASMSRNKWIENTNWQRRIWNYIRKRAAQYGKTLVVGQKELVRLFMSRPPIAGVEFAHFNDLSGIDNFGNVDLIVSIGRVVPPPEVVERLAAILGHCDVQRLPAGEWYPLREAFLPLKNSNTGVALQRRSRKVEGGIEYGVEHHPDPLAEAVRWTICVGELVQALGRGRGLRRTEANPLQLDILTTQDAGIPINEFGLFEHFETTAFEQMIVAGLVPQDIESRGGAVLASEIVRELFDCDPKRVRDGRGGNNKAEYSTREVEGHRPTRGMLHGFVDTSHPIHGVPWKGWSTCTIVLYRDKRHQRVVCFVHAETYAEACTVAKAALTTAPHRVEDFKPSAAQADAQLAKALGLLCQAGEHTLRQDKRSPEWAGRLLTAGLGVDDKLAESILHQLVLRGYLYPASARDERTRKPRPVYHLKGLAE